MFVYISNSTEPFLKEVAKERTINDGSHKNEVQRSREENLMEKSMHSAFLNKMDFRDTRSWEWLRTCDLKKATEGTIMAAQEQATRTRMTRHTIDKGNVSPLCRICGERNETVVSSTFSIRVYNASPEAIQGMVTRCYLSSYPLANVH